jgi:hypothetical protein
MCTALYFAPYVANVPGTFFNATHQETATVIIGISKSNPLA